ncbi:MAG: hypothetical protein Q8M76_00365 [Spirochaetaceae bacterium]|nr:hypothetical protein [Spirochaetaceae bacterium]
MKSSVSKWRISPFQWPPSGDFQDRVSSSRSRLSFSKRTVARTMYWERDCRAASSYTLVSASTEKPEWRQSSMELDRSAVMSFQSAKNEMTRRRHSFWSPSLAPIGMK